MENLKTYAAPLGRLFLSALFIWAGIGKLMDPAGTAGYFAHVNIPAPAVLVWIVLLVEIIGGLMVLVGFKARWAALVLAIFCVITGFGVHLPVGDLPNMTHFYKNIAIAGGLLYVFSFGAGVWSVDGPGK
jgi:putative oxidoreductase